MNARDAALADFLEHSGWGAAARAHLAGDASNRRYERLRRADGTVAVLMDSPDSPGAGLADFLTIAKHLRGIGLSAPEAFFAELETGFCILEDFGDGLFAKLIRQSPAMEEPLYCAAIDLLIELHKHPCPNDLLRLDPPQLAEMTKITLSHYAHNQDAAAEVASLFEAALTLQARAGRVLAHRDYHVENLFWLPERDGVARVGLIDFQDAFAGHPAYDLASLLKDARRDVSPKLEMQMLQRYLAAAPCDAQEFTDAYHLLGAQRNLRILGVFARLSQEMGKPRYLEFMPRVWNHLQRDLDHPALASIAPLLRRALPAPTPEHIESLLPA